MASEFTAAEATVGMIENVVGDAEVGFGASGDLAPVDDRGHLGRNAEGFRGDFRGGATQTLEVRGASYTMRETERWEGTSTTSASTRSIGDAYEAGLSGEGPGSTVEVGASTLGRRADEGGRDGLVDMRQALESGRDTSVTRWLEFDPEANDVVLGGDGRPLRRLKLPDDLYGVVALGSGNALAEGISLSGEESGPLDSDFWSNLESVGLDGTIGSLEGCRDDAVLGGDLNDLEVLGYDYCEQATCSPLNANACTEDVRAAYNRCLGQKTVYEEALVAFEECLAERRRCQLVYDNCFRACGVRCAPGTPRE